jgi:hypothetical protein
MPNIAPGSIGALVGAALKAMAADVVGVTIDDIAVYVVSWPPMKAVPMFVTWDVTRNVDNETYETPLNARVTVLVVLVL